MGFPLPVIGIDLIKGVNGQQKGFCGTNEQPLSATTIRTQQLALTVKLRFLSVFTGPRSYREFNGGSLSPIPETSAMKTDL